MEHSELIPHLFRTEFRKIASVLCKRFGIDHIEIAEDIASDTFLAAFETWNYRGIPPNPTAWLYTVAKNKAQNELARNRRFSDKVVDEIRNKDVETENSIDLSDKNISDSQLQMLFALCHPSLPPESQIGLSLRILCGFGIEEIATAFLTSKETINKRLFRAREKLRQANVVVDFPGEKEIGKRLETVMTTLYLLFNEGYYSESNDTVLRNDLCLEAMRLTHLLVENPSTNLPAVNALLSLMCFHASRFGARMNSNGELVLYNDQDEKLWDRELIARGGYYLKRASQGDQLSTYHLEASIAYWHTVKDDTRVKWENILNLYNQLLALEYSPVAALNRAFALSKVKGVDAAIKEATKLDLSANPYYFMLLGDLYEHVDNHLAKENLRKALSLTRSSAEKQIIQRRMERLNSK